MWGSRYFVFSGPKLGAVAGLEVLLVDGPGFRYCFWATLKKLSESVRFSKVRLPGYWLSFVPLECPECIHFLC